MQCPAGTFEYTIRAGDTFFSLAQRFNTTVEAIQRANPGVNPDRLQIGQVICIPGDTPTHCPPGTFEYTVRAGDTFFSLAQRFNITVGAIQRANPGVDPDRLQIGQIICIPRDTVPTPCPPGTFAYTIRAGDTFFTLARRFGTTVDAIQRANPDVDPDRLQIGQIICIPGVPSPCPPGTFAYTVRAGDTFFTLARRFGTTVDAIQRANPNVDPDRLQIGQTLCIPMTGEQPCPSGTTPYIIRAGDTFFSIARRAGITVDDLIRANPNVDPDRLQIGQIICIPSM